MARSQITKAVYAGTFDPITNGHIDIISRALKVFEFVYVAVAGTTRKNVMFELNERVEMVREAVVGLATDQRERLTIEPFKGLLVDYVSKVGAAAIIRGLRAVTDYEYEAQMAMINRELSADVETVFFVTSAHCAFISSSVVKEIATNNGDVTHLVPPAVIRHFSEYNNRHALAVAN